MKCLRALNIYVLKLYLGLSIYFILVEEPTFIDGREWL